MRQYDLVSGQELPEISLAGAYGNGVAFAAHRPYLIASDGDGNLRFWHRDTGQPIGIPMRFQGYVNCARGFRPGTGRVHDSGAGDSDLLCRRCPTRPATVLSAGDGSRVRGLVFAPSGHLGVVNEHRFELFDPANRKMCPAASRTGRRAADASLRPQTPPARWCTEAPVQGWTGSRIPNDRKRFEDDELKDTWALGRVYRIECLPGDGGLFVMGE